ncbi:MAG: glycosyltransferase [Pseudomonadota bacterium]
METIAVSTVTPVYHGATTLPALVAALAAERDAWAESGLPVRLLEAVFVDDGSSDGSADVLATLANAHPFIRVVTLSRNFGQHPATIAGTLHTSGDWVVTLDEDLQHHPCFILKLLGEAVRRQVDVVYAKPDGRVHQRSWYRDLASRGAKSLVARLTGNANVRLFNSYRLMRGAVARAASAVAVHDAYFDMLLAWFTNRVSGLDLPMVDGRHTDTGSSGYNLRRLLSHLRRLLMSAEVNYLRVGAALGILGMAVAGVLGVLTIVLYFVAPERILVAGWASLFVAVVFFGGLTALLIGVLFEYFSTVRQQTQGKPTFYVVDRSDDTLLQEVLNELQQTAAERETAC